jgi:hypothetical protein
VAGHLAFQIVMFRHFGVGLVAAFVSAGQGARARTSPGPVIIDLAGAVRSSAAEPREASPPR